MVGVEAGRDRRMIGMAVRKPDDLELARIGVLLHPQLLEGIERVAVPGPIADDVAHATKFRDLVVGGIDTANQRAAGLVGIAPFEVLPHPFHHGSRDSQRQNLRR